MRRRVSAISGARNPLPTASLHHPQIFRPARDVSRRNRGLNQVDATCAALESDSSRATSFSILLTIDGSSSTLSGLRRFLTSMSSSKTAASRAANRPNPFWKLRRSCGILDRIVDGGRPERASIPAKLTFINWRDIVTPPDQHHLVTFIFCWEDKAASIFFRRIGKGIGNFVIIPDIGWPNLILGQGSCPGISYSRSKPRLIGTAPARPSS
jgi:hypothetical protein